MDDHKQKMQKHCIRTEHAPKHDWTDTNLWCSSSTASQHDEVTALIEVPWHTKQDRNNRLSKSEPVFGKFCSGLPLTGGALSKSSKNTEFPNDAAKQAEDFILKNGFKFYSLHLQTVCTGKDKKFCIFIFIALYLKLFKKIVPRRPSSKPSTTVTKKKKVNKETAQSGQYYVQIKAKWGQILQ